MKKKQNKFDVENQFPCQLPQVKLSCWGCCGREFKSRKEVERDIAINTFEFLKIKIPSTLRLLQYRDRFDEDSNVLTSSGICSNLVDFKDGCLACPLHDRINDVVSKKKFLAIHKKDLRYKYCDIFFECDTVKIWKKFSKKEREKFVLWLEKQKFVHYDYSVGNVEGVHIRKYLEEKRK